MADMVMGDYRLIEKIGAGGMGEVWRAQNVHTRVPCAIKLLPMDAAEDPGFVARFFDEGRVMQTLEHPHIVRVHHVGHDERSGRYFLVMDLIEGPRAGGPTSEVRGQRTGVGRQASHLLPMHPACCTTCSNPARATACRRPMSASGRGRWPRRWPMRIRRALSTAISNRPATSMPSA